MKVMGKTRIDAWDAVLTDEQRWRAYAVLRRSAWYELAEWVEQEYGIDRPSRSAIYRWAKRMRRQESARRVEQAIEARTEIGALAGTSATNDRLIEAYKSMAAELALQGDAKEAVRLTSMAMSLAAQQTAQIELELRERRLDQQDEAQGLAREKFEAAEARLKAVQDAVNDARKSDGGLSDEALRKIEQAAGLL